MPNKDWIPKIQSVWVGNFMIPIVLLQISESTEFIVILYCLIFCRIIYAEPIIRRRSHYRHHALWFPTLFPKLIFKTSCFWDLFKKLNGKKFFIYLFIWESHKVATFNFGSIDKGTRTTHKEPNIFWKWPLAFKHYMNLEGHPKIVRCSFKSQITGKAVEPS